LFQSLFGAASASESCSKSRSEGSTGKVSHPVEIGLKVKKMNDPPRRRFMRPWKVIEHDESYEVQDATGLPLASVYFENETI